MSWQLIGLAPPKSVCDATAAYLEAEDAVGAWIEECCQCGPQAWASSRTLFGAWNQWATSAGEYVGSQRRFIQALETRGFVPVRKNTGRGFAGIELRREPGAECWPTEPPGGWPTAGVGGRPG